MLNFKFVFSQTSSLVSKGTDGKLIYTSDSKGNKIPDFSGVGYMNSESPIPSIPIVRTVYPVSGNNLLNIQNAINEVAALPLDANGFRGAILFKAGKYLISDTIKITASGIVLRGEGADSSTGTHFVGTKPSQFSLFYFSGNGGINYSTSSRKAILDAYVPIGTKQITVAAGHTFLSGDKVLVHRIPKDSWVRLLNMDSLNFLDSTSVSWVASAYDLYSERKVTAINGNIISLDAPIMDLIDTAYATGELMRYTSSRIEKCGIENMCISSTYTSETDENHGWEAVTFNKIINSWAKNLQVYYFGYAAVHVLSTAAWITIDSCKMYDPKSTVDGGRRYSFNVDGQRTLVQNCVTRNGRHDYVNGSRTCGPVVFYNCSSTLQLNDIGPHHRWSTGILYDNIVGDGRMDVQNRLNAGTGHGWAGAQIMFWNCNGNRMVIQDPQGDHRNWAIGCQFTEITNVGDQTTEPFGIVESKGIHITAIPSLFKQQLTERIEPLKQNQTISFNSIPTKTYGNSDFIITATASSTLPVIITSGDTAIATVSNDLIHIKNAGTVQIIANQSGNIYFNAASSVIQNLVINRATQTINFPSIPTKSTGTADFGLTAYASSGLAITYTSSNVSVATIVNNNIHIVGVGTSIISAVQSGNSNYTAATTVTQTLTVVQGAQTSTLQLKAFLEGFYIGNRTMASTLYDLGISTNNNETDSIEVNLWSASNLNNTTPNFSSKVVLKTDGTTATVFPGATVGNSYYIAIKHRNSVETWSAAPVAFSQTTSYDFTTGTNKAIEDGVNPSMKQVGAGVYAIYSGDVNKDGGVDGFDSQIAENDASNFEFGYHSSDCNGDGSSDAFDAQIIENNGALFIFSAGL